MDENTKKAKLGRPSKYNESYAKRAEELASKGCTHREIYETLEISESTFYQWKLNFLEFAEAIQKGEEVAVPFLLGNLKKVAEGHVERIPKKTVRKIYSVLPDGTKIQEKEIVEEWEEAYYKAPDANSLRWMLANRSKGEWKLNPDNFDESGDRIPDVNLNIGTQVLQGAKLATSEQEAEDLAPDLDEMHEDLLKDEEE